MTSQSRPRSRRAWRIVRTTRLAGTAVLIACAPQEADSVTAPDHDVLVSVGDGAVTAPDTVSAGWTRVRVEEDGEGHILVIFRLPEETTDGEVAAFLGALDTAVATPRPAVALGGPEIGDTGEVIVELTPGRYVLGCVRRGSDGHRHASAGEAGSMVVRMPPAGATVRNEPPDGTQEVPMADFAYPGPDRWSAGSHLLRVENRGRQDHQLRIARLRAGSSLREWMSAEDPGAHVEPVAGVARLGPGMTAYLPVELARGTYVLHCLIADPASGRMHVELGMFRQVLVD